MTRRQILQCAGGVLAGATLLTGYVCRDLDPPAAAVLGVWAFFVAAGAVAVSWLERAL